MTQFAGMANTALKLITKYGESVVLRSFGTPAIADPNKPWRKSAPTTVDNTVRAVFLEINARTLPLRETLTGDMIVYIAHKGIPIVPELEHKIVRQNRVWSIVAKETIQPNDETLMYILQVRV